MGTLGSKYLLDYVADPSIPVGDARNHGNQRSREFRTNRARFWFCLWDREARASVIAGRSRFLDIIHAAGKQ